MRALIEPLYQYEEYRKIREDLENRSYPIHISGCTDSQKSHLIHALGQGTGCRLVLTYREEKARELYENLSFFDVDTVLYPSKDILFYSADIHSNQVVEKRMDIFRRLAGGEDFTIVACFEALLEKLIPFQAFQSECLTIDFSSVIELAALRRKLVEMGYESCGMVEKPGDFSTRGSIIDIFPLTEEAPVRIELWDEEVDSIRSFDVDSQRSIEKLEKIEIYPASDMILTQGRIQDAIRRMREDYKEREAYFKKQKKNKEKERLRKMVMAATTDLDSYGTALGDEALLSYFYEETESLLDYLPSDTLIFIDEPVRSLSRGKGNEEEFFLSMEQRLEGGYILPGQADLIYSTTEILERLKRKPLLLLSELSAECREIPPEKTHMVNARSIFSYHNNFEQLVKDLRHWKELRYQTILMSSSRTRAQRLAQDLRDYELNAYYATDYNRPILGGEIMVVPGRLSNGFEYPDIRFAVLTEKDIFKEKKKARGRKYVGYKGQKIAALSDLSVGDYVVHEKYGLGIYRGIESIETDGVMKDYISIEYQDNSNYLFPASQLEMIQKYASGSAKKPKLNKLNSPEWKKTKSKVRSRIQIAAKDLVDLYASRQAEKGFCFGEDTVWQKEFEELFPYEETEDQLNAIEDTKSDMESPKIMDRLICGDVGYGKTEVAIRAAFKAVQDSRQVALLVPTTILAQQHYNSFLERMERYPVEIRMLSRFCSAKETREILEGLKNGSVDIVIGTHKLLSTKVRFKHLGLLIIDEEQRFGVKQKEKIKQIKKNVDVLALSATPIPRTLHMSLAGIRDMSLLEIPPVDRRAVQTYVLEYNEEMIREAIERELARDGQVYYVSNRVSTIMEVASKVQSLVPEARVEYAHGQMSERQLEGVMMDFIRGEIDVLVSTTIIETGLDIPNVNTMIIQDAQNFGLSQLYQLRGRVGRSKRTAYAFLMYQRNKVLREEAEKRLKAIREFTDLGSGFKIAMRDLEIRGAGNLLGAEQSGHIESVGYDLYCKMLNQAVKELKGESREEETADSAIDLSVNAYIPSTYVKNESQKLSLYKRIAYIETREDYDDMVDELTDRYGDLPAPLYRLLDVALLRARARKARITLIEQRGNEIRFVIAPKETLAYKDLEEFLNRYPGKMRIAPEKEPTFLFDAKGILKKDLMDQIGEIVENIMPLTSDRKSPAEQASEEPVST